MTPPALVGTVLDEKFQIEKALASGASGDVYEAVHLGLGSRVAVKVLRPGAPETADVRRKRFMREARVAARVQSDHVVRVFDIVAPEGGLTYIVMELLAGETLGERLRRVGPLSVQDAVDWIMQAAKPLAELHDAGIVHRDVKPSNLFLARDTDGKERIKLLDFGVAAFQQPVAASRQSSLTLTEAVIGTPRYMAPEQVRSSKSVDARADVWALGVTLFEMLAGAPPFDGETVIAVLSQIETQEAPKLLERRPGVPPELANVVHRCLAKPPGARPADARALAKLLAPFAGANAPVVESRRGEDALDLSLSDDDVEVVRPLTTIAPARATLPRTMGVAALVGAVAAIALVSSWCAKGPATVAPPPTTAAVQAAREIATAVTTAMAATPIAVTTAPPPLPSRGTTNASTVSSDPSPPLPSRATPKRGGSRRSGSSKPPPSRPPTEDDDRIE